MTVANLILITCIYIYLFITSKKDVQHSRTIAISIRADSIVDSEQNQHVIELIVGVVEDQPEGQIWCDRAEPYRNRERAEKANQRY